MFMLRQSMKTRVVAVASAMLLALTGVLAGCSDQSQDGLPETHLDQLDQVAADHERCGACHWGATRGNGSYETLDYSGMESLPFSEFEPSVSSPDGAPTESLYVSVPEKEGAE